MKKVGKTISGLLVILTCVLICLPIQAQAAKLGMLTYEIADGQVTITDCDTSVTGEIVIPDTIEGYPVTGIGSYAFSGCTGLTAITIPDSVTSIGTYIFTGCSGLTEMTIPFVGHTRKTASDSSQSPLGSFFGPYSYEGAIEVFQQYLGVNCDYASGTFYIPGNLKSVTVTDGNILQGAFQNCTTLTSVTILGSTTCIEKRALDGCTNLTSVKLPDGLTSINTYAFRDCTSLTAITLPDSLTSIGDHAFIRCTSLTSIRLPDGLTSIGRSAFHTCTALKRINIPDSVTTIEECAFYDCTSLITAKLPNTITEIKYQTFYQCASLTAVTIPETVTVIEGGAFDDCTALTDVYYGGGMLQWTAITLGSNNGPLAAADFHWGSNNITFPEEELVYGCVGSWGLILKENIGVNFQMNFTPQILIDSGAYVELTVGDKLTHIPVNNAQEFCVELAAAQMTELITLTVVASDGTRGQSQSYSICQYADTILNGNYKESAKQLVRDMLHYGAAAQLYFSYNTNSLANEGIGSGTAAQIPETAQDLSFTDSISTADFYGASLVYRNRIAVRYYFTGDISSCSFTANGNTYNPVAKDGMHYVEIADILPQDLDQQITLTAQDSQGNTICVCYGPMNYIVRMNQNGGEALQNLVQALYSYHLSAKNYLADPEPEEPEEPEVTEPEVTEPEVTEPEVTEPETTEPEGSQPAASSATFNFSDYGPGVQYATESYDLGNGVTLNIDQCHMNTQLRIYQSTFSDGTAVFTCSKAIHSLQLNAGYKNSSMQIYGSTDGITWILIDTITHSNGTSYTDYTVEMPAGTSYRYLKLDAVDNQIRIANMTFYFKES